LRRLLLARVYRGSTIGGAKKSRGERFGMTHIELAHVLCVRLGRIPVSGNRAQDCKIAVWAALAQQTVEIGSAKRWG